VARLVTSSVDADADATSVRTVPDDSPAALTAAASLGQREKR
jgi:hypothetical protein